MWKTEIHMGLIHLTSKDNCKHEWVEYENIPREYHCKLCDRDQCIENECQREATYSVQFVEWSSTPFCNIHYLPAIHEHIISITSVYDENNELVKDLEDLLKDDS